jgi:hypothetical protein
MRSRLLDIALAGGALALAMLLALPVFATVLTPGWIETANLADWAACALFLSGALALLFVAWRLLVRRLRPTDAFLASSDWWFLTALAGFATLCVGLASNWGIAAPGLLVIAVGVVLARRRAHVERQRTIPPAPTSSPDIPRARP